MNESWQLPWIDPIAFAEQLNAKFLVLLYSGARYDYTGRYSYLCIGAKDVLSGADIEHLKALQQPKSEWHENFWVGWLGYSIKNQLERLSEDIPSYIDTLDFYIIKPETIMRFDHFDKIITAYGAHVVLPPSKTHPAVIPLIKSLKSNMTSDEYKNYAAEIINDVAAGKYYQANLTRKYYGDFSDDVDGFALFKLLTEISPSPYSVFIGTPDIEVISSSPEQFLRIDDRKLYSRPIKGSIKRGDDPEKDDSLKMELEASEKNRAENLMIVDLMRNDFSKVCKVGSIKVDRLFEVTTHPLIHHLSSTISGELAEKVTTLDAVLSCFPPGSMTGAPKISAMQKLSEIEKQKRGIYSGAIGWFAGDGSAELSVVIRTIIKKGRKFEFQVGGGIVADSTPESELQELITKALGICKTLGIRPDQLL